MTAKPETLSGRFIDHDWLNQLSPTAKAEILASVFHLLSSHQPEVWAKVPKWLQSQINQAMNDCSIDIDELSSKDISKIQAYVKWLEARHPRPKSKRKTK
jgi:hypothetical protein